MNLLMTKQVYESDVAVGVFATLFPRLHAVGVYLFTVEEGFAAVWAFALLSLGYLHSAGYEVFGFRRVPLLSEVPQTWVVGRSIALNQDMPFNREPYELL